jgi:phi13 family phage major tail protein
MPRTGLKYPVYAHAVDDGSSITYSNGAVFAEAVTADINVELNNEKFYSNDTASEVDNSFKDGTLAISVNDFSSKAKVDTLGYKEGAVIDVVTGEKELSTEGAEAPYIGFGFYGKGKKRGVAYYRAIWLKKIKFGEPSDKFQTRTATPVFNPDDLVAQVLPVSWDSTYWKDEARFSTEAAAIAWLNGKAGISSDASNNITALSITNGTLTPTFAAATRNYSCSCSGNIDITATFAAGTAKVYVDGVYTETLATTVKGGSITMAAGNNKIIQIVVQESGKSPITYTIMAQRSA